MTIFCTQAFKIEFEKLIRKKSYSSIEIDIIEYFFNNETNHLSTGIRLNNSTETPFIKKRLNGRGGFRLYFLLLIKDEKLFLMFVHPKTGSLGYDNITDKSKALLYKNVLSDIQSNNLYYVTVNINQLIFKKT